MVRKSTVVNYLGSLIHIANSVVQHKYGLIWRLRDSVAARTQTSDTHADSLGGRQHLPAVFQDLMCRRGIEFSM
jgi:hypothetical protein